MGYAQCCGTHLLYFKLCVSKCHHICVTLTNKGKIFELTFLFQSLASCVHFTLRDSPMVFFLLYLNCTFNCRKSIEVTLYLIYDGVNFTVLEAYFMHKFFHGNKKMHHEFASKTFKIWEKKKMGCCTQKIYWFLFHFHCSSLQKLNWLETRNIFFKNQFFLPSKK